MKATGIVRRIDDLGRVVIPKEIRRTMRIREGDPLEIFTDHEGEVIFKKYSPIGELTSFASQYAETLHKICDLSIAICDRDTIIASAGVTKKEFNDKSITKEVEDIIENRVLWSTKNGDPPIAATDYSSLWHAHCIMPIITEGDVIGGVISLSQESKAPDDTELKLIRTAATFLGKQLEE